MNSINSRIKDVRKESGLNQSDFAKKIGLTQRGVSHIEQEGHNASDVTIKSICQTFLINEKWLRDGVGPKSMQPNVFSLDKFAKDHGMSDRELGILKAYFEIDPKIRTQFLDRFLDNFGIPTRKSIFDGVPNTSEELERQFPPVDIHNKTAG